jgi:hypothetical protein
MVKVWITKAKNIISSFRERCMDNRNSPGSVLAFYYLEGKRQDLPLLPLLLTLTLYFFDPFFIDINHKKYFSVALV